MHSYAYFCLTLCCLPFCESSTLHFARASGDDHASTGVPPQSVEIKPTFVNDLLCADGGDLYF